MVKIRTFLLKICTFFLKTCAVLSLLILALFLYAHVDSFYANRQMAHEISQCEWTLDPVYSSNLSIGSAKLYDPVYGQAPFTNSYKTVDHIQIYKGIHNRHEALILPRILLKERLFESKDKDVIKRIILAAQDGMQHADCGRTPPDPREMIYVVGFNETTKQAGYFVVSQCYNEKSIGVINGYQGGESSAIYFSTAIIDVLKELKVLP